MQDNDVGLTLLPEYTSLKALKVVLAYILGT